MYGVDSIQHTQSRASWDAAQSKVRLWGCRVNRCDQLVHTLSLCLCRNEEEVAEISQRLKVGWTTRMCTPCSLSNRKNRVCREGTCALRTVNVTYVVLSHWCMIHNCTSFALPVPHIGECVGTRPLANSMYQLTIIHAFIMVMCVYSMQLFVCLFVCLFTGPVYVLFLSVGCAE